MGNNSSKLAMLSRGLLFTHYCTDLVVAGPLSQAVLATTPASGESLSSSGGVSSEQTVLILREELEIEEFEGLQEAVEKFRCRGRPEGEERRT